MKVLEPRELEARRKNREKKSKVKRHKRRLLPIVFLVIAVYVFSILAIPVPALRNEPIPLKLNSAAVVNLKWPSFGQSAIGALGYGVLAQNGEQKPLPIASTAKVLTAVAVLKVKPLSAGEQGELITITAEDEATYTSYLSQGQSVVKVKAGEQITEYQALQALLLPSANNMAEILVKWAFGSSEEYITFVNTFAKTLGMNNTNIADASGYSPQTTSVAGDLAHLAEIAMNHPIISEIVGQTEADIPVAGTIYNVNNLLGQDGVNGIKTGTTDEAGGCFMFSAKRKIDESNSLTVVGVIMGAPDRSTAVSGAVPLLNEAFNNFKNQTVLKSNDNVGLITRKGGAQVPVLIENDVSIIVWNGQEVRAEFVPTKLKDYITAGDTAGELLIHTGNVTHKRNAVAGGTIASRSVLWRLRHAGGFLE